MRTTRFMVAPWLLTACLAASALPACNNEQGLRERAFKNIAVATGDFDEVEATLTRLDIAHTNYEGFIARTVYGHGLGLYIAREMVEAMDGQIWVESDLGTGS